MVTFLLFLAEIGTGWSSVMINSVAELELIRGQQQSNYVGNTQSYWVGGSTYESGDIEFSDYEPYPEGISVLLTEEKFFSVSKISPKMLLSVD